MMDLNIVGSCLVQGGDTTVTLDQEGLGTKTTSEKSSLVEKRESER